MILTCKQAVRLLAGGDGVAPGWRRRLRLSLHLLMCEACRRYKAQIEAIRAAAKQSRNRPQDQDAIARLQDRILGKDSPGNRH